MDMETYNTIFVSALTSATTVASIKFFYGKLVDHSFNKKLEQFKSELLISTSKEQAYFKESYRSETEHLSNLWKLIYKHIHICGNLSESSIKILSDSHSKIENYIYINEIFFSNEIFICVEKILELTEPSSYENCNLKELLKEKNVLTTLLRDKLYVEY